MKKTVIFSLSTLLLCATVPLTKADDSAINVTLNGQQLSFDQPPIMENNRTLVPLRAIFEALGASVTWNQDQQIIDVTKGSTAIRLQIGWDGAWINHTKVSLDVAPEIVNDRTLVPVRFVSEALGANVQWDGNTNTVVISTNGAEASTGTPGEGLSNFGNQTGLGITNWSVKLDKFGDKKKFRAVVTGKITNNNQTTTSLNWSWFLIRKPGQNAQYATLDSLLFNASDFDILPGDSVDMNLSFSIPIGDTPSDYQLFIKSNDGSLIPISTLTGYQDGTNYSLATGTELGDYGVQDGFEKAVGDDVLSVVDYLLQNGKTGKDVDSKGEPVLKYAIDSGDPDMIDAIVKAGADVNIAIDGMLPTSYASKTGKLGAMVELQKLGAKNSGTPDGIGQGSYELVSAVINDKTDAVKQLLN